MLSMNILKYRSFSGYQIDKNNNFRKYLRNASGSRIYFEPITEHKTMKIIEHMKIKTSTGINGISDQLVKLA